MNDAKFIKLDNGLTILIYSDNSKISNHIELVTFLGGKCRNVMDNDGNSFDILPGSAHFLEHFICERNINGNLIDNLKEMGALSSNAMTGNYDTSFYVDTVVSFDECLDMFLNSVYHPVFNKKNIDDTRGPVLCEIRDDNDNFRRKISYRVMSNVFANNVKTLGNKSSVKRTLINTLMNFIPTNERIVYAGLKENISSPHQIVTTNTSDINVLEALSPSYLIYANKNADTLLKLVNKEQGIISSFDIRKFTLANLVTNVMLENPNMDRDNVIASIYTGFDILVYMEKGNDKKIRVTGIKEVQTSGLKDVFIYKDNTFSLIKESNFTYKKIKDMGNNTLDDIFGV